MFTCIFIKQWFCKFCMSPYLNKASSSHLGTVADLIFRIFYALPNPLKEQNMPPGARASWYISEWWVIKRSDAKVMRFFCHHNHHRKNLHPPASVARLRLLSSQPPLWPFCRGMVEVPLLGAMEFRYMRAILGCVLWNVASVFALFYFSSEGILRADLY